jgi:hypothetical protein
VLVVPAFFAAKKRETAKTTDYGNIKAKVVPPTRIVDFIDGDVRIKQTQD